MWMTLELGDVDDVIGEMDMTYGTAEEYEKEVILLVNQEREKRGLSPLTTNDAIMAAAHARLKELDIEPSHTRPNGSSYYTILPEYGMVKSRFMPLMLPLVRYVRSHKA